jgi:hypothetical protein
MALSFSRLCCAKTHRQVTVRKGNEVNEMTFEEAILAKRPLLADGATGNDAAKYGTACRRAS